MNSLNELCTPRESVFDPQKRDTVLDLTDLVDDRIAPDEFFTENYITEGMQVLLEHGFRRLEGKSEQGLFKLAQRMGGGKTHNLLVLGLLAKHPELREKVMGGFYKPDGALGPVRVIAFTGRESDAPMGIWGSLAEQMGKKNHFKDCYSPLQAPGQKAWENLFAGETVLILLDELAPYFEHARSKTIGNSDLAHVTATALSNLLVAIGRPGCSRVCLVVTELSAAYERGSAHLTAVLDDLDLNDQETRTEIGQINNNQLCAKESDDDGIGSRGTTRETGRGGAGVRAGGLGGRFRPTCDGRPAAISRIALGGVSGSVPPRRRAVGDSWPRLTRSPAWSSVTPGR